MGRDYILHKGRVMVPKRMNFRNNSKRPLTPLHFRKIVLQMLCKGYKALKKLAALYIYGCLYASRYEGQIV